METIRLFVERLIVACGISGISVPIVRHIVLALVVVIVAYLSFVIGRQLILFLTKIVMKKGTQWNPLLLLSVSRIIPAIVVRALMPLVFYQYPWVRLSLSRATAVYITVMATLAAVALLNSFEGNEGQNLTATQQYFKSFRGVLKIVIFFLGAIVAIALLIGRSPMTLIAGLGATSAVLMLVFKDTISGLVAGIQLTSNNMVRKGDWITVPNSAVDGVVEEITLTTVKVRNFDHTIVTVTPQTLVSDSFQNWIGMQKSDGRRVKRKVFYDFRHIKLTTDDLKKQLVERGYFTANELQGEQVNMALYRRYVERMLAQDARVNHHLSCLVRQLEATSTGLPLEFYFFLSDKEWVAYEHQVADLMEKIYALAADFDVLIYQTTPQQ
ncbi:mechanosensitive ion channel domain-containing protein [Segatella oulorum]|uniref:mechanosensitive ion channel family protein n=1 Tax=Segatella oulorum TaxID=28136 RepID=UPI0028E488C9|nr:mechanosensitive ion channel domain-containing protein [Segatella oulorum]